MIYAKYLKLVSLGFFVANLGALGCSSGPNQRQKTGTTKPQADSQSNNTDSGSDAELGGDTPVQNGPNGEDNGAIGTGPKETPGGCADAKSIADPNATYVFEKPVGGDPWYICTGIVGGQRWCGAAKYYLSEFMFENARKINPSMPWPIGWAPSGDNVTASTLCHLKGYSAVAAYDTAKTKDSVLQWDPVSRSFVIRYTKKTGAELAPYLGLLSVTCKGKLIDSCISDQSWIYGKK